MGRYRFGPLGRLMVVDVPDDGFDDPVEELGGVHESLNGTRTKDVLGRKGTWKISMAGLDARALSWFEMAYQGALGSPLYFLDEERVNRLSAVVSSNRAVWSDTDPFVMVGGTPTLTNVANTALLLPGVQDGQSVQTPAPFSALTYVTTTGVSIIRCGPPIPVQVGERVVFSFYVLAGAPVAEFTPYDANLAPLAQAGVSTTIVGPPDRRYAAYTVPAGVAAVQPCIRHPGIQSSMFVGLQLEAVAGLPTPWVLGAGSPQVIIDSLALSRRKIGNYQDADLSLLEV